MAEMIAIDNAMIMIFGGLSVLSGIGEVIVALWAIELGAEMAIYEIVC